MCVIVSIHFLLCSDYVILVSIYMQTLVLQLQESGVSELAFFSPIMKVTYIQNVKHEMDSVHSPCDLGIS